MLIRNIYTYCHTTVCLHTFTQTKNTLSESLQCSKSITMDIIELNSECNYLKREKIKSMSSGKIERDKNLKNAIVKHRKYKSLFDWKLAEISPYT